jgi:hypothetical protein
MKQIAKEAMELSTPITEISDKELSDMYEQWHKDHFCAEIPSALGTSLIYRAPKQSILATLVRTYLE